MCCHLCMLYSVHWISITKPSVINLYCMCINTFIARIEPGLSFHLAITALLPLQVRSLRGSHRVEVHVYAPEWITLVSECSGEEGAESGSEPDSLTTMATQLLIMISKHIQTLASDWFSGPIHMQNTLC